LTEIEAETALVAAHRQGEVIRLLGATASKQAVLGHLPRCSLVHVASHAVTDGRNPSNSRLNLFDGALLVREISRVRAGQAELAYLSACETAMGAVHLPDEAIHICTAFQLAGFRNVIATLWRVPGRAARDTAAVVYSELGRRQPSQAVNLAARRMREAYRANPYEWAAFIHSGSG
jgi:CHAT domain-containing protein